MALVMAQGFARFDVGKLVTGEPAETGECGKKVRT